MKNERESFPDERKRKKVRKKGRKYQERKKVSERKGENIKKESQWVRKMRKLNGII